MKRFVLVLGLLLSSVVNAQDSAIESCNWDRLLEGRPLWYTEDLKYSFWLVENEGQVIGHLQDSVSGKWYYLEVDVEPVNCGGPITFFEPTYNDGVVELEQLDWFQFADNHDDVTKFPARLVISRGAGTIVVNYYVGSFIPPGYILLKSY